MSKIYDKSAAAFKATTIDTKILDAQNIKVYPGEGSLDKRVNLLDLVTNGGVGGKGYNSVDSEIVRELKNRYTEYSNLVFPLSTESGGNVYTSSFRFGYKHCPKGLIKKISLYARDANSALHDSKTNGCYLIAKVYNKADSSLVRQQTSTNKVVVREKQSNETERPLNTWQFDGILAPNENEIIKFIPSPDGKNQVDAYYLGFYVDTTHTHNDCQCGGDWDYINDPLRAGEKMLALCEMEGDFYQNKEEPYGLDFKEKEFIKSLYTVTTSNQKLWDNNVNNESVGQGQCMAFTLVRPYITNGVFSEVRWDSQGAINSTVYCRLTLRDTNGKDVKTLVSYNTENFSGPGVKSFRFNEEFEITDNIGSLLFETSTDGVNPSTAQWRIRIIGNATKPNTDGGEMAANNPYICQVIFWGKKAQLGGDILTKTAADNLYVAKDGIVTTSYDWTPDLQNNIKLEVSSYTMPVNGWLVSRDWQYLAGHNEIRINGLSVGQVNPDGNFSLLVKKDDVLTVGDGEGSATFWFLPCKSEQNDYRVTHTQYDVWRGAVTTVNGNTVVQDMHCPDASGWYNTVRANTIATVIDEVAYDSSGNVLCNIQSSEIVNGSYLMTNQSSSLTNWDSDLQRLENGKEMFEGCTNLTNFVADLSSLTSGEKMFRWAYLNKFNQPLPKLENGYGMFYQCDLSEFASDLSSLINGESMFDGNTLSVFEVDNLDNLQNGKYMFLNSGIEKWNIDLPSLTNSESMFYNTPLVSFKGNMPKLTNGQEMFSYNENLSEFRSDLSALTNGSCMFESCWGLKTFDTKLPVLENGERMFNATSIESFVVDELPELQNGHEMFSWIKTKSFTTKMPKLKNGLRMFYWSEIQNFDSDLSSLTNGYQMFNYNKKLTTFTSDLSSLTNGDGMFNHCTNLELFDWRGGKNITKSSLYDNGISFVNCPLNHVSVKNVIDMYTSSDNIIGSHNMYTITLYANKNSYKTFEYLSGLMNYDFSGLEYHTLIREMENGGYSHLSYQYVKNGLVTIDVYFVDKPYNEVIYGDNMLDGCIIESPVDDFYIDMTNSKVKSAYRMFADAGVSDTPPLLLGNGGSATFNLSVNGSLNNLENAEEMFAVSDDYFGWKDSQGQCNVSVKLDIQPFSSDNPCKMTNVNNMFDGQTVFDRCTFDAISNIANYCFTQSDVFLGKLLFVGEEQLADRNLDECVYCSLTSCLENLDMLFAEFGWKVKSTENTDTLNFPAYIFNLYKVNEFGKTETIKVYIHQEYIYR